MGLAKSRPAAELEINVDSPGPSGRRSSQAASLDPTLGYGGSMRWLLLLVVALGCGDSDPEPDAGLDASVDGGMDLDAALDASFDGGVDAGTDAGPVLPEDVSAVCPSELCWMAGGLTATCGRYALTEDFSSGRYGAHEYTSRLRAGVETTFEVRSTGGTWDPVLFVFDVARNTVYDGNVGLTTGPIRVVASDPTSVTVIADADTTVTVVLSSWAHYDAGFTTMLPTDVSYELSIEAECEEGGLLTPPNFDEGNVVGGYYLLPQSDPAGLYTRKPDDCSRGTRLLIDVIYTAAVRWAEARPELGPLNIRDMNEGSCSTVDHATHDDGTHVDITATCATQVSCADDSAAIDLARIFIDTGVVCGILFNDTGVQGVVNPYFESSYSYEPWRGQFMRTVTGHTNHFHVRVMKPDGTCN